MMGPVFRPVCPGYTVQFSRLGMECSTRKHSLLSPVAANRKSGGARIVRLSASSSMTNSMSTRNHFPTTGYCQGVAGCSIKGWQGNMLQSSSKAKGQFFSSPSEATFCSEGMSTTRFPPPQGSEQLDLARPTSARGVSMAKNSVLKLEPVLSRDSSDCSEALPMLAMFLIDPGLLLSSSLVAALAFVLFTFSKLVVFISSSSSSMVSLVPFKSTSSSFGLLFGLSS
mmetsp:Transcript_29813/g.70971  ORF Transcript_29813/g.70971 Transcript_29813/m.70971 type:complete len:226 (-) Transcript_29813:1261-1938(-)